MRIGTPAPSIPAAPKPAPSSKPAEGHYSKASEAVLITKDVATLVFGDLPTLGMLAANVLPMPHVIDKLVHGSNGPNTIFFASGVIGAGVDIHRMRAVYKDPKATTFMKHMERNHLILGDIIPTLASGIPLLGLTGPVAQTIYIATQLAGVASDTVKTVYDMKQVKDNHSSRPAA